MDPLELIRQALNEKEPKLIKILQQTWTAQGKAITIEELKAMLVKGKVPESLRIQWEQDFALMISRYFSPVYQSLIITGAMQIQEAFEFKIDLAQNGIKDWIENRGAELVVQMTTTQKEALKVAIDKAAVGGEFTVDQLSRVIRPTIGLTRRESGAVVNYFNKLTSAGRTYKDARVLADNYAKRLHRYRAMRIARTELAYAYNQGNHQGMEQAKDKGYIAGYKKKWLTADDERVCPVCGPLDGVIVEENEYFMGSDGKKVLIPPYHVQCRCVVQYITE